MTTLQAIVDGDTYNLSDGTIGYRLAETGMGIAPLRRYSRRGPRQHGVTDTGFRLEPRLLQLGFVTVALTPAQHYSQRNTLMSIFMPSDDPILLRWTLPNGDVRQIDAFYNGGLDFDSSGLLGLAQQFAVELYAPDPIFYNPTEVTVTATSDTWSGGLAVPMAVPMTVGESNYSSSDAIVYSGSWESYPVLRINGPIIDPVISHAELGLSIPLTSGWDSTIGPGNYWDIDLRSGIKTITNIAGVSKLDALADENDLTVFRLVPGTNTITMTGRGANGNTSLEISYHARYIGV